MHNTLVAEHEVVSLTSAVDARSRIAAGERFDLIFRDLMMPVMTGMDLHAELARIAPDQAAAMAFLTGGAFTPRAQAFLLETSNPRLDKPFDVRALRGLVRERITRGAGSGTSPSSAGS